MSALRLVSGTLPAQPEGREVLVTPPDSLTGETFGPQIPQHETPPRFFIDWLSVSQVHPSGGLPLVDAGTVIASDTDGVMVWKTSRAVEHEGSFDTSINVKCDGERVTLSGNLSRFGRRDNLFGFDFAECMRRANEVLAHHGLPPFSAGSRVELAKKRGKDVEYAWTGARVSRIDLTANYCAGSADDAHAFMQWLGSQHAHRQEGQRLGQGETVAFGAGSRRSYWKAYLKALELKRHEGADPEVIAWCDAVGLVRFEGTLRSNLLTEVGAAYLGDYERGHAMGQLIRIFEERSSVLGRATAASDDMDALPRHLRATARDYMAGMDLTAAMSRASFYRHRSALLPYGIDIAVRNVRPFTPRVRVIELAQAVPPSWYQLAA